MTKYDNDYMKNLKKLVALSAVISANMFLFVVAMNYSNLENKNDSKLIVYEPVTEKKTSTVEKHYTIGVLVAAIWDAESDNTRNDRFVSDDGNKIGPLGVSKDRWSDAVEYDKSIGYKLGLDQVSFNDCFNIKESMLVLIAFLNDKSPGFCHNMTQYQATTAVAVWKLGDDIKNIDTIKGYLLNVMVVMELLRVENEKKQAVNK